jgi:hypothetical protein
LKDANTKLKETVTSLKKEAEKKAVKKESVGNVKVLERLKQVVTEFSQLHFNIGAVAEDFSSFILATKSILLCRYRFTC